MSWSLRRPVASSGWTIETVLEYSNARIADMELRNQQRFEAQTDAVEAAIIAQRAAIDSALIAANQATTKAETATELRFRSVNEFRQTLSDQAGQFITRTEANAAILRNTERIQEVTSMIRELATKVELINAYERIDGRIQLLERSRSSTEGKSSGLAAGWGYLVAALTVGATLITLGYLLLH